MTLDPSSTLGPARSGAPVTQATNPFHISRAYGVRPAQSPDAVAAISPVAAVAKARPSNPGIDRVVGAVVPGGVEFGPAAGAGAASTSLAFYTRAGDRIEAATALQVGRTLDTQG